MPFNNTCALVLACGLLTALNLPAETLRDCLKAKGIDLTGLDSPNLDKPITSGDQVDDQDVFLTAYYLDDGSTHLHGPLQLEMLKKKTKEWLHREISQEHFDGGSIAGGSVIGINHTKNGFYLFAHINPSAGTTIMLSPALEFRDTVFGAFLGDFANGPVVYANSMVHFAPTHPGHVSVYDPTTKSDREIYPMKPYQAIRLAHIAKVKAAYDKLGKDWLRAHNHHGDPEQFSNYIGKAATSDATESLAFIASFDNVESEADECGNLSRCRDSFTDVVYVYRHVRTKGLTAYREMLMEDVKAKFGDVPLSRLLESKAIEAIFDERQ